MDRWDQGLLRRPQAERVADWIEAPVLVEDLSWGLVDTVVLHVRSGGTDQGPDVVVKAAGPENHHIGREITAHEQYTGPLVALGHTGRLIAADREATVLVTEYLPGRLVQGSPHEHDPDVHAQAGTILRALHDQRHPAAGADPTDRTRPVDDTYERRATAKAVDWLDREHRIGSRVVRAALRILQDHAAVPVTTVPTHGDWQPRNWLVNGTGVAVIDFGRAELRPPATDLCRLAVQQWAQHPALEPAFLAGYGHDPRTEPLWSVQLLREAVGTAVWAFAVGDEAFEQQGHQMLDAAIARF